MAKKKLCIAVISTVIILLAVLVPQHQARADAVTDIAQQASRLILAGVGKAVAWAAQGFDAFVQYQTDNAVFGVKVVDDSWATIRDFVNLFFILILIIMAFGTIFDIKEYTWRDMLVPFLIVALLINFSLVIGQYIITVANGLAGIFLRTMTQGGGSISEIFAQGFSQVGIVSATPQAGILKQMATAVWDSTPIGIVLNAASPPTSVLLTAIFGIIFLVITFLAFLSAFIFSLARIFVLWFLLIISPIAWLGYALPNLRKQTWSEWWKHFFCWCFFLPYYLFFLMFAVIFIKNQAVFKPVPGSASITIGSMTLNNLLIYGISLIFLIGGLFVARKMACATGSGVKTVFGKIDAGVKKYMPGAAYVRGAWGGVKARGEEIQEKGVLGIGGAQRTRIAEAGIKGWVAGIPGLGRVPGAREETNRVRLEEIIKKEVPKLALELQRLSADERKEFLQKAQDRKGVAGEAALLEYAKQGYSTKDDYVKAIDKFGGENTALGRQYLKNLVEANLRDLFSSSTEELDIARPTDPTLSNLRRELWKDLAKRNQISSKEDYKIAKDLFSSTPTELKSFLDSIKPEYIVGTKETRQDAIRNRTLGDTDLERKLVEFMKDKKEINDVRLRQEALAIVDGKDTIEGRNIINEINKFNPAINIEADLREERGTPVDQSLSTEDNDRIVGEIADKIAEKEFADLRKMSSKFWEDKRTQRAVRQTFNGGELTQLLENAPKEMRRALKNLPGGGSTTAGDGETRRPAGFVPSGSTVTPEGRVIPPEDRS